MKNCSSFFKNEFEIGISRKKSRSPEIIGWFKTKNEISARYQKREG